MIGDKIVKVWEMAQASIKLGYDAHKDSICRRDTLKWALQELEAELEKEAHQAKADIIKDIETDSFWDSPCAKRCLCIPEGIWEAIKPKKEEK